MRAKLAGIFNFECKKMGIIDSNGMPRKSLSCRMLVDGLMDEKWPVLVINMHTMIGGAIGVLSLFLPWVVKNGSDHYSLVALLAGHTGLGMSLEFVLPLVSIVFIMGTLFAFLSPYAASAQLGGAATILFVVKIAEIGNSGTQTVAVGPGPYVGLASAAVVFLSIIFPFGLGYGHWKPLGNRGRNYAVNFYRDLNDSDGMPYWWWAVGPGWFWYWWFEMRMGWAFRDAWEQRQRRMAEKIAGELNLRERNASVPGSENSETRSR